jgi:hypothetical protein
MVLILHQPGDHVIGEGRKWSKDRVTVARSASGCTGGGNELLGNQIELSNKDPVSANSSMDQGAAARDGAMCKAETRPLP